MSKPSLVNGYDPDALNQVVWEVARDHEKAVAKFGVTTAWQDGTRSLSRVANIVLGGEEIERDFKIELDQPVELLGMNTAPNPQEMLMAAFNACMIVGYVTGASLEGIQLEKLEIETDGELDLRGFLGLDPTIKPGYDKIRYTVRIKGNGTDEQFQKIHERVTATSPSRFNLSQSIRMESDLLIE